MPTPQKRPRAPSPPARPNVFDVDCKLSYTLLDDTHFLFIVHALDGMDQVVEQESLRVTPSLPHEVHADPALGHRTLRMKAPAGPLTLRYKARVRVDRTPAVGDDAEIAIEALPHDVLSFLLPTRYCEADRLAATAWKLFADAKPGGARVQAVVEWIHANLEYRLGSSNTSTTACDVFLQRAGVCRDFAHLGVTFCRALNVPARLVVGYARFGDPPPDFHACFEAFLGGRWQIFDPTRMIDPQHLVRIAVGRDAGDVAFATLFGPVRTRLIRPEVERVGSRRTRRAA